MKRILFLIGLIAFNLTCFAQSSLNTKAPDYDKIEKNIQNKGSNLYYPKLMERYEKGDTTLTLEEKRHLYYGYPFQSEYRPRIGNEKYSDSLRIILSKEDYSEKDLRQIIIYSDSVLKETPFSLNTLEYIVNAYKQLGDTTNYKVYSTRIHIIIDAFSSSGNGFSEETAFYVIYTYHEYFFINMMGFSFHTNQQRVGELEYFKLDENNIGLKGLYFNISPSLNYQKKHSKN